MKSQKSIPKGITTHSRYYNHQAKKKRGKSNGLHMKKKIM